MVAFAGDSRSQPATLRAMARKAAPPLAWFTLACACLGGLGYLLYRTFLLRIHLNLDLYREKVGLFHFVWVGTVLEWILNIALFLAFVTLCFVFIEGALSACVILLFVSTKLLLALKTHDRVRKLLLLTGAAFLRFALALQFWATFIEEPS
ncbi:hypothetical protein [Streptomyces sp. XH2]|uniref:hypothetical protein n=1 Tax=Streptomyces sp. XH2 TaxID=3412483 RepID=UPI003C7D5F01